MLPNSNRGGYGGRGRGQGQGQGRGRGRPYDARGGPSGFSDPSRGRGGMTHSGGEATRGYLADRGRGVSGNRGVRGSRGRGGSAGGIPYRDTTEKPGYGSFQPFEDPFTHSGKLSIYAPTRTANLDSCLLDGSQEAVVNSLHDIDPEGGDQPFRPDFGILGKPIYLRANFFPMNVPERPLYEYDMKISPDPKERQLRRRLFQLLEQTPDWLQHGLVNAVAHDHSKKLISTNELVQPLAIKLPYPEEPEPKVREGPKLRWETGKSVEKVKEYTIAFEFTQIIDTKALSK